MGMPDVPGLASAKRSSKSLSHRGRIDVLTACVQDVDITSSGSTHQMPAATLRVSKATQEPWNKAEQ
jgi:hypothetical protein